MAFRPQPAVTAADGKRPVGREVRDMAKAAVKSKKRAKPAKGMKHHRGVLDVPKAVATRMAEGRAERESVPLEAHDEWAPSEGRPDPIGILEEQNATRVPELVPIRHGRMIVSPFTFYRGGAAIMAADLSQTPSTRLRVQCCGDTHLSNFGLFAAPDRSLVFDLNDFDETLPAPWEWDLKRMAASIEIAGRDRGEKRTQRRRAVGTAVRRYREAMRAFAGMTNLQVWYARLDISAMAGDLEGDMGRKARATFDAQLRKAEGKDSLRALTKLTEVVDGELRFRTEPPLLVRLA